jgi:hypothetical protein
MKNRSETEVQEFLERLGFEVEPIAEVPDQRRADLRVSDSRDSYIIEVKTREGSSFEDDLRKDGVAGSLVAHAYANSVSGVVGDAVNQLDATLGAREEHQLVWYHSLDEDECEQVRKTLYGIVTVIRPSASGAKSLDCLYLTFSEFFRYPQLAGAVLGQPRAGVLFLNVLSPACAQFRTSRLFSVFQEHGAVWDPVELEIRGDVYVADCPGTRNDRQTVLKYVEEKYGVKPLIDVEPNHVRVAVLVPRKNAAGQP